MLKHLDIPQIVGLSLPRRVLISNPKSPQATRLTEEAARSLLGWAFAAASTAGPGSEIEFRIGYRDSYWKEALQWAQRHDQDGV